MNINNYECDGQMSIEDFLVSNNQEVKRLLHSGEVVFEAIKGDVERHVVTDEHWYIEHLKTYGNRTRVHGAYGQINFAAGDAFIEVGFTVSYPL